MDKPVKPRGINHLVLNVRDIEESHTDQRAIGGVLDQRADPRRGVLALVAEADGEIVGNVLISVDRGRATEHIGVLSICIAIDWRDVGIGSELVAAAQAWARERGLGKISLGVFPDNERAIAVYERRGFVREGLRRRQYRSGDTYRDEVLMAWFPEGDDR